MNHRQSLCRGAAARSIAALCSALLVAACASPPADRPAPEEAAADPLYTFFWNGRERTYRLHVPENLPAGEVPLVFVLHSAAGNGALIAARSGMNAAADARGFIAVYPDGTGVLRRHVLMWNGGHCCGYAQRNGIDDVGYIDGLLDHLLARYPVDPARVYAVGFSNGGMLVHRLAARLPERFAAVAVLSGTLGGRNHPDSPYRQPQPPATPVSVLIMHGRHDQQVPYEGGPSGRNFAYRDDLPVQASVAFWRAAGNCALEPEVAVLADGAVTRSRWGCADGHEVILYTLEQGGHAWPGGEQVQGAGLEGAIVRMLLDEPVMDLDATAVILDFFFSHARTSAPTGVRSGGG